MFFRKMLFFVSILCVSTPSAAGMFVQAGLHAGGDTLATVDFFNADDQSIKAGGLVSGSVGYEADLSDAILMKLSAGVKFDTIDATNAEVDFIRYPLNGMIFFKTKNLHLGAGITQHLGVKLSVDGEFGSDNVTFKDATGFVLQMDYLLNERGYLSLVLTSIDYELKGTNESVDGNSIGVVIGYRFGK